MKKCILIHVAAMCLALSGCVTSEPKQDPEVTKAAEEIQKELDNASKADCTMEPTKEVTVNQGTVTLPASGFFVMESHYATREQKFGSRLFPNSSTEGIQEHLKTSCAFLKVSMLHPSEDCSEVYNDKYSTVWTPPEGGKYGQGAVGDLRPTVEQEVWQGNMYWKGSTKPKPGVKYLICNSSKKCVVLSMGYETGPAEKKFLGGVVREVHWYLNAQNGSVLTLGKLKDQSLPYGPVICK